MRLFDFFRKSNDRVVAENTEQKCSCEITSNENVVILSDTEWESLYKTDFEKFWEMVVREGDLTKLPDYVVETRSGEPLRGEDARQCILSRIKREISPSIIDCEIKWDSLLRIKHELVQTDKSSSMLDVARVYIQRYIVY